MMAKASRKEVAKLAGVSEATVSRVFNNILPLREETKQKVLEAARVLEYYPNALAQSFARGKSGNIGVIVPYMPKVRMFSTHYFSEILSGIGKKLADEQYGLLLLFVNPTERAEYEELFRTQKIDGCIILGSQDVDEEREAIRRLHESQVPYCIMNQHFEGEAFHVIDAGHEQGSYDAVSYLIQTGHRKIAFLNGPMTYSNSVDRLKGYIRALHEHQIDIRDEWLFTGNYSRTSGLTEAESIRPYMDELDAIFVANDRMAIGLMQGLNEHGIFAGKDYSLIGYDDSDLASFVYPQLSSVHVPLFEMGVRAAEMVLQMMAEGQQSKMFKEQLQVSLKVRKSIIERG